MPYLDIKTLLCDILQKNVATSGIRVPASLHTGQGTNRIKTGPWDSLHGESIFVGGRGKYLPPNSGDTDPYATKRPTS